VCAMFDTASIRPILLSNSTNTVGIAVNQLDGKFPAGYRFVVDGQRNAPTIVARARAAGRAIYNPLAHGNFPERITSSGWWPPAGSA
jgi:hypothetical protein